MALVEVPLTGGAYQARALVAAAQEAINIYPERNPKDGQSPSAVTSYLTPGLTTLVDNPPAVTAVRQEYRASSNGVVFVVIGDGVYTLDSGFNLSAVGTITFATSPVCIIDNGIVAIIVDGSTTAYVIDLDTLAFASFSLAEGFLGADKVCFLDTFLLFNLPGTNIFYSSLSNIDFAMVTGGTAFDALDIAAKTSRADPIVTMDVINGEIWIVGEYSSEVWSLVGGAGFPFARIPGAVVNHGCCATYGQARSASSLFWLMRDDQGFGSVVMTQGTGSVVPVTPYAMVTAIQHYPVIADCIMYTRQEDGHYFLVVIFPSQDVTWEMDIGTGQWHKWSTIDDDGVFHRHRSNCYVEAFGKSIVGDYANGKLYDVDHEALTDAGTPIVRLRSFPVIVDGGREQSFHSLILDMQGGYYEGDPALTPLVTLRGSDTGGASWQWSITQTMGALGEFLTSIKFGPPLGMARNRVYEVSWSVEAKTAINRAWSDHDQMPW
jgi:hypothetical protein